VISEILQSAGYPGDTLVADFETYFDKDYSLKEMSTVEHIADGRFEFTGLGIKYNDNDPVFVGGDHAVRWLIRYLKRRCGDEFEKATVVVKNAKFDVLILLEKFGIRPKYVIDVEDLTRYYDSRMSQKLKDVAKLLKLKNKGEMYKLTHVADHR
jgi:hypothetical protein